MDFVVASYTSEESLALLQDQLEVLLEQLDLYGPLTFVRGWGGGRCLLWCSCDDEKASDLKHFFIGYAMGSGHQLELAK